MLYSYLILQLQDQNDNTVIHQQGRAPPHLQTEVCAYFDKRISCAKPIPWPRFFPYLAYLHLNYMQVPLRSSSSALAAGANHGGGKQLEWDMLQRKWDESDFRGNVCRISIMVEPCIDNIRHLIIQLMHTNYKILRLLKYL